MSVRGGKGGFGLVAAVLALLLAALFPAAVEAGQLQQRIDSTAPRGVCILPAGTIYDNAVIDGRHRGIKIYGAGKDANGNYLTILRSAESTKRVLTIDTTDVEIHGVKIEDAECNEFGGAIFCSIEGSTNVVDDCQFMNCYSWCNGGALCDVYRVENCSFIDNNVEYGGNGGHVCGSAEIHGCTFSGGSANYSGGAVYVVSGHPCNISHCTFQNNTAIVSGGAIRADDTVKVEYCKFFGNRAYYNDNVIGGSGGAIYCNDPSYASTIFCCLFKNNYCGFVLDGGTIHCPYNSYGMQVLNCTIIDEGNPMANDGQRPIRGGSARDCIVKSPASWPTYNSEQLCVYHVTDDVFADSANGDYHLRADLALRGFGGDVTRGKQLYDENRLGLDGEALVNRLDDYYVFKAGCYGYKQDHLTLQLLIDNTKVGGVCKVPAGTWDTAEVKTAKIKIVGEDYATTIVDGGGSNRCLRVDAEGVVISNLTFRNGFAEDGGAIYFGNSHGNSSVNRCHFDGNNATSNGGALFMFNNDNVDVFGCLFTNNHAGDGSAAVRAANLNITVRSCTFFRNTVGSSFSEDGSAIGMKGDLEDCIFYRGGFATDSGVTASCCYNATSDPFYKSGQGNFHLHPSKDMSGYVGSSSRASTLYDSGVLDLDGDHLVNEINGTKHFYAGCYAFVPVRVVSDTVTSVDDTPDSNLKASLREVVAEMAANPGAYVGTDGNYRVNFANKIFDKSGCATLRFAKAQIDVSVFTNGALVIEAPAGKTLVLDGGGKWRPLRVKAGNRLTLSNLTFANCLGSNYGAPSAGYGGGAVQNHGLLVVSNCAFRACHAGNGELKIGETPAGAGGAILNCADGTCVVARSTFADCWGAVGGAVANLGLMTVVNTTFHGNRADGAYSGVSSVGGALYVDGDGDLALVNCTLANNFARNSGGGVFARGSSQPALCLLNTIVVGNTADSGGVADDMRCSVPAKLWYSVYGVRNEDVSVWTDVSSAGRYSAAEVFAQALVTDVVPAETRVVNGVEQSYCTLNAALGATTASVWMDGTGENLGYTSGSASYPTMAVRGTTQGARQGERLLKDQLGTQRARPMMGARWDERVVFVPGPPPTALVLWVKVVHADGSEDWFESPESARVSALVPGDVVFFLSENFEFNLQDELPAWVIQVYLTEAMATEYSATPSKMVTAVNSAIAEQGLSWYSAQLNEGNAVSAVLNSLAVPTIAAADFDAAGDQSTVSVQPADVTNVRPWLSYGLGRSETVTGPFAVGSWVQADDKGVLPSPLTAPRSGPGGFYRIIVK